MRSAAQEDPKGGAEGAVTGFLELISSQLGVRVGSFGARRRCKPQLGCRSGGGAQLAGEAVTGFLKSNSDMVGAQVGNAGGGPSMATRTSAAEGRRGRPPPRTNRETLLTHLTENQPQNANKKIQ